MPRLYGSQDGRRYSAANNLGRAAAERSAVSVEQAWKLVWIDGSKKDFALGECFEFALADRFQ